MTEGEREAERPGATAEGDCEWERRRRLARIFGDVLPESTSDDTDTREGGSRSNDAWLRAQVPPHHGA